MNGDYLDTQVKGGVAHWKAVLQFWAFRYQYSGTQPFSVLYAVNPYRSQIINGEGVSRWRMDAGWSLHSTFWAYSTPGNFYIGKAPHYYLPAATAD